MDINSVKIGTIGKFHIKQESKATVFEKDISGVIVSLPNAYDDYYIVDKLGKLTGFRKHQLTSVSSIRISKELRAKFISIAKKYDEIQKMEDERERLSKAISELRITLRSDMEEITNLAGYYSSAEFNQKIQSCGFTVSGVHQEGETVKVMLQQSSKGERYSFPYEFPFLHQRYDGTCIVKKEQAPQEHKLYLLQNAPEVNDTLAKLAENVSQEISVGDKYIYALTKYWIPLKEGYTHKDVDNLIAIISSHT